LDVDRIRSHHDREFAQFDNPLLVDIRKCEPVGRNSAGEGTLGGMPSVAVATVGMSWPPRNMLTRLRRESMPPIAVRLAKS
jgi:hypothetical protein